MSQKERMNKARIRLILNKNSPFFGTLSMYLTVREVNNKDWCPTFQTDGTSLFYNPEFAATIKDDELVGIWCHEIMHCALRHMYRINGRDLEMWNQACDHVVNQMVLDNGFKLPAGGVIPEPRFKDKCVEEIYGILNKEKQEQKQKEQEEKEKKQKQKQQQQQKQKQKEEEKKQEESDSESEEESESGKQKSDEKQDQKEEKKDQSDNEKNEDSEQDDDPSDGDSSPDNSDSDDDSEEEDSESDQNSGGDSEEDGENELDDESEGDGENEEEEEEEDGEDSSGSDSESEEDDDEESDSEEDSGDGESNNGDDEESESESQNDNGNSKSNNTKPCPTGSFSYPQKDKQDSDPGQCEDGLAPTPRSAPDWEIALEQAKLVCEKAGKMPLGAGMQIENAKNVESDLVEEMRKFIEKSIPRDFSWQTPNKKFIGSNIIIPGVFKKNCPEFVCVVDTSGSMVCDNRALRAVGAILTDIRNEYQPEKITIIYCDTQVYPEADQEFLPFDIDEIKLIPKGGGGTYFQPAFDYIEENFMTAPSAIIFFTDLYSTDTPKDPNIPTLWVTMEDSNMFGPWGTTCRINHYYLEDEKIAI